MGRTDAFKQYTERLVNELKRTAESVENTLKNIEEQVERLLHTSDHIHNSLSSIDVQSQELAETSKHVEENVNVVLEHSQSIYEQSLKIAYSQLELGNRQVNMNERLDEGMTMLNDSMNKLGEEMNNLRNEAVEIEKKVRQSSAVEVLHTVTCFQSQAHKGSRGILQQLIELGHKGIIKRVLDMLTESAYLLVSSALDGHNATPVGGFGRRVLSAVLSNGLSRARNEQEEDLAENCMLSGFGGSQNLLDLQLKFLTVEGKSA
ncbi:gamete expressed 1-like protein [Tanacetum coccineum]